MKVHKIETLWNVRGVCGAWSVEASCRWKWVTCKRCFAQRPAARRKGR